MNLRDEQWAVLEPLMPVKEPRADGKGRPRRDDREVLDGILWVLRTGAAWQDLPDRYPSPATCHRRFQEWRKEGVMEAILQALARDLKERGKLDLSESYIDGFFVVAKRGAGTWERPHRPDVLTGSAGKVRRSWQWQTAMVFLSPSTLRLLRRMKSPLWKQLSHLDLSWKLHHA
jgi:transposase